MFGVIDIGSNTIRLSLYEVEDSMIRPMLNKKRVVGLASYINDNGILSDKGIEKAIDTLNEYNMIIERIGLKKLFVFATASLRNIKNTEEAVKKIQNETNIDINVISGEKEAFYDYVGVTYKKDINNGIILDIGGGSTEIVFVKNKNIEKSLSIPIGSLNMYKKYVKRLIPTQEEGKKIKKDVLEELKKIDLENNDYSEMYGIGGSVRGTFKLSQDFFELEKDNKEITRKNIKKLIDIFEDKPQIAISEILEIVPDRIHTIPTGMIILKTIMKFYNCKVIKLSEYGVREGYLIDNVINNKSQYKKDESSKEDANAEKKSDNLNFDQNVVKSKEKINIEEKHPHISDTKNDSIDEFKSKDSVTNDEADKGKEVLGKKNN
ncbi:MAG: phosphatase [Clostridium sp.]